MFMSKKELNELRDIPQEELNERLISLRTKLAKERATIASGTRPENPGNIRKLRKDIARILTIISEKKMVKKPEVEK